jgi:hypothetical protein
MMAPLQAGCVAALGLGHTWLDDVHMGQQHNPRLPAKDAHKSHTLDCFRTVMLAKHSFTHIKLEAELSDGPGPLLLTGAGGLAAKPVV